MTEDAPTQIGRVSEVEGSSVKVALDQDMAGVSPIYQGKLHTIGQAGTLVRIPQGLVDLIATVNKVGVKELANVANPTTKMEDERSLHVELIGQIDHGTDDFQRGVGSYPGLNDPVHFTTPSQLKSIFPSSSDERLHAGHLSANEDVPVTLDADQMVVQHTAVVGSTGSGKTSAVSSLLQNFVEGGWKASNIVVIDPHGEYAAALEDVASIRSVLGEGDHQLRVPYWALPAEEILRIFVGGQGKRSFTDRFKELVTEARCDFVENADWLDDIDPSAVSADTPIPFEIRPIWHKLDSENQETREEKNDPDTACVIDPGDADELIPAQYKTYGAGGKPPHKSPRFGHYGTGPDNLRLGLLDPQLQFFQKPTGDPKGTDPLVDVTEEWLGGEKPISVLDFSGVPSRAADVAIGAILDLLFELALRSDEDDSGIGRSSPVFIVLEEAHRYLGKDSDGLTRDSANRIAREGRKYGIGLLAVSQRPNELPDTALAQCGTFISLRLTNSGDQGTIKAALPDTIAGIADALPSLRTHEAIVSGEAVELPVRAFLDKPDPWPDANDPSLESWRSNPEVPDVEGVLASWRDTYQ